VRPDVVSCTALVAALGADGQWQRAERVVAWMLQARRGAQGLGWVGFGRVPRVGCAGRGPAVR